jgi:hypothetical protein
VDPGLPGAPRGTSVARSPSSARGRVTESTGLVDPRGLLQDRLLLRKESA